MKFKPLYLLVLVIWLFSACAPVEPLKLVTPFPSFQATVLPTSTPTFTPLPTFTPTITPTPTSTLTPTPTATQLPSCYDMGSHGHITVTDGGNPAKYIDVAVDMRGIGYSYGATCNMGQCLVVDSDQYPAATYGVKEPVQEGGYVETGIYTYLDDGAETAKICVSPQWTVVEIQSAP